MTGFQRSPVLPITYPEFEAKYVHPSITSTIERRLALYGVYDLNQMTPEDRELFEECFYVSSWMNTYLLRIASPVPRVVARRTD